MRSVGTLACVTSAVLALAPGATAQVVDRAQVRPLGGNQTAQLSPGLELVAVSPPEYRRGCCLDSNSGEWLGPPYADTSRPNIGDDSTIDWSAYAEPGPGAEAVARRQLVHAYAEYGTGSLAVTHVVGGRPVGTIPGVFVVTQGGPFATVAQAEGTLAFPLGGGLFAGARFALLQPSSDQAPPDGQYRVNHSGGSTLASQWNREQLAISLRAVRLDGNLPPSRVTAARSGRSFKGAVTDAHRHPLARVRVRLERRVGSRWRAAGSARTSATGRYSLRSRGPGRYRVVCTLEGVTKRSRPVAG